MPSSPSARAELRALQDQIVLAVLSDGTAPPSVCATELQRTRLALLHKRRHTVKRVAPFLSHLVSEEFDTLFQAYAGQVPLNCSADATVDARSFGWWLVCKNKLKPPQAARVCWWMVKARLRR